MDFHWETDRNSRGNAYSNSTTIIPLIILEYSSVHHFCNEKGVCVHLNTSIRILQQFNLMLPSQTSGTNVVTIKKFDFLRFSIRICHQ